MSQVWHGIGAGRGRSRIRSHAVRLPDAPQIVRDQPGNCPICGMALEPRVITRRRASPELLDMTALLVAVGFAVPVLVLAMGHLIPAIPPVAFFAPHEGLASWF